MPAASPPRLIVLVEGADARLELGVVRDDAVLARQQVEELRLGQVAQRGPAVLAGRAADVEDLLELLGGQRRVEGLGHDLGAVPRRRLRLAGQRREDRLGAEDGRGERGAPGQDGGEDHEGRAFRARRIAVPGGRGHGAGGFRRAAGGKLRARARIPSARTRPRSSARVQVGARASGSPAERPRGAQPLGKQEARGLGKSPRAR